jgi:hypothetical protein
LKQRVKDIIEQGDKLFSEKGSLNSLHQRIADHFYPERADFTTTRSLGDEFAAHLMTGWPVLMRRELANSIAAMLRPRGKKWFRARTDSETVNNDPEARAWLDWASDTQMRIMYARASQFMRATKEGDNDFITFGQAVISREMMPDQSGLLYRCWHLRDSAWCENEKQMVDTIHIKWEPTIRELKRLFPNKLAASLENELSKNPYKKVKCRRVVLPSDSYDYSADPKKRKLPFVSLYIDCENEVVLEETPLATFPFTVPRWVTVSGSQYAYSPATVVGLPDARLLQDITLTLLESGQKAVDPPMKATHEAIIGGLNLQAGGVSWIDRDYDERFGAALEPAMTTIPRLDFGVQREEKVQQLLQRAFFLDQIRLPDLSDRSTAYEVQKRVEEYIRYALPLFEPLEVEYNGALCEGTFEDLMRMGAFGSPFDMPSILRGQEVRFQFESPLQAANDRAKAEAYTQAAQLLSITVPYDPTVVHDFNLDRAFRDAILASGVPATWLTTEEQAAKEKEQARQAQSQAQAMAQVGAAAESVGQVGEAVQQVQAAGII